MEKWRDLEWDKRLREGFEEGFGAARSWTSILDRM